MNSNLIIIGDSYVGKTSLLNKISDQVEFRIKEETNPTISADVRQFNFKSERGKEFKFNIADLPGLVKHANNVPDKIYEEADLVLLVYDVTKRESFNHIAYWNRKVNEKCKKNPLRILISNKNDADNKVEVESRNAKEKAVRLKLDMFHEVSAKSGAGVEDLKIMLPNLMDLKQHKNNTTIPLYERQWSSPWWCPIS